jgi:low temperature requirement protein LtrA
MSDAPRRDPADDRGADSQGRGPRAPDQPADPTGSVRQQPELRVTTLELFFDLIFAFTLTQLTVLLATPQLSAHGVVQVLLVFGLLWWMYGGYAWLTNARPPVRAPERLLVVVGMAGFLVVGLAIPRGFGGDGVALGLGYLLVILVHTWLYARVNPHIWRIAPFNVTSALLVIAAGFTRGVPEYALWVAALLIQAGAPLVVRLGGRFDLRPAHFAERHGALVIVAIGESIAAIGIGASDKPVDVRLVVPATAGLALAVVLWWLYFGTGDDEQGEHAMRRAGAERRPGLALSAYFYAHIPILLGIVFAAAGVSAAASESGRADLKAALALGIGSASFVAGTAAFRSALRIGPVRRRLAAAMFALVTVPVGALVAIEAQLGVLTAGLAALLALERSVLRSVGPPAQPASEPAS